ncbi:hypothetical protein BJV82DRAFT_604963 [Fennellomyces sp. T-0311]|nr:hypothetical protein BJV82DRAFT_604963 [Fennellomyces sp. T-0311]
MFFRFLQTLTDTLPGKPILPVNAIPNDSCNRPVANAIPSKNDETNDQLVANTISFGIVPIDDTSVAIDIPSGNGLSQRQQSNGVEYKLSQKQSQQVLRGILVNTFQRTIAETHSPVNGYCLNGNAQTRKNACSQISEEHEIIAVQTPKIPLDQTKGNEDDPSNSKADDEERFYCPYKGCKSSRKSRNDMIYHVRKNHDANVPRLSAKNKYAFKSGSVEVRFNKDSRGTLEDGDTIVSVKVSASSSDDVHFCPYKNCSSRFAQKNNVYKHIRAYHCSSFALPFSRNQYVIKAISGQTVNFDESSRNLLNQGETPIIMEQNASKPFYCPYEGCAKQYTRRANVFHHIRSKHDLQFPLIRSRSYFEGAFMNSTGEVITFDASSQNKLSIDEQLVVAEECMIIPQQ